jgi:hypothetical protein
MGRKVTGFLPHPFVAERFGGLSVTVATEESAIHADGGDPHRRRCEQGSDGVHAAASSRCGSAVDALVEVIPSRSLAIAIRTMPDGSLYWEAAVERTHVAKSCGSRTVMDSPLGRLRFMMCTK